MSSKTTYQDLEKALHSLGFQERKNGAHRVFAHSRSEVLFVLPDRPKTARLPEFELAAVKRMVVERGVTNKEQFGRLLEGEGTEGIRAIMRPRGNQLLIQRAQGSGKMSSLREQRRESRSRRGVVRRARFDRD